MRLILLSFVLATHGSERHLELPSTYYVATPRSSDPSEQSRSIDWSTALAELDQAPQVRTQLPRQSLFKALKNFIFCNGARPHP